MDSDAGNAGILFAIFAIALLLYALDLRRHPKLMMKAWASADPLPVQARRTSKILIIVSLVILAGSLLLILLSHVL